MFFRLAFVICSGILFLFFAGVQEAQASVLKLQPSTGTFTVGSTFDVSVYLDTEGEFVNAIDVNLEFPARTLQLSSPSTGPSIIEIWTSPPRFNNQTGTIELLGGIPRGINVSNGLIIKLTFRVKSTGSAIVKFSDASRVLLNDGLGSDSLYQVQNAVFRLALPPPAGPIVVSETHPDQLKWYQQVTVVLSWASAEAVDAYSYMLSAEPVDFPDDTSEGARTGVAYKGLASGKHYFHIKALKDGRWGGTTHFGINIDAESPAEFSVEVKPSPKTKERQPIIQFFTTDSLSGLDHFELKTVPLSSHIVQTARREDQPLFIEIESPFILSELELGAYDIIVRAYDNAGNIRETVQRISIVTPLFQFVENEGLRIKDVILIPWLWLWLFLLLLLLISGFFAWWIRRLHHDVDSRRTRAEIPSHVKKQLAELKEYRVKYGKMVILFVVLFSTLLLWGEKVSAQDIEIGPPVVTTVSRNISNDEIFYIGGKTEAPSAEIIIYLQNLQTGETISRTVSSDKRGDWLYRHDTFLSTGTYLLWTQAKLGEQLSPPSPQIQFQVQPTAIQLGASRISFETLYLLISVFLFVILISLIVYIVFHGVQLRAKHHHLRKEIRDVEESIRRGFAVLRRDIEAELAIVKKARMSKELSIEERLQEEQLLRDLDAVEKRIGKEIWDVERVEGND